MIRLVKLSDCVHLILTALLYALGTGIARYLGATIQWPTFWLGLLAMVALKSGALLLVEYFRLPFNPLTPNETPRQRELGKARLLQAAYAALTLASAAAMSLLLIGALRPTSGILLVLSVLLLVAETTPPLRLLDNGYGELVQAVFLATFLPAFSFLLHADEFHRLLPLMAFPLTLLAVAWLLAFNFATYSIDQKNFRRSLLIRLTWQRAVPLHHVLVLAAFLLFAASPFFGVSWALIWPVFLAVPFAVLQITWLQRIANGGTPVWKFFNLLVPTAFGLTIYLLTLSFWLR